MLSSLSALAFLPFAALILTTFTARGDTYQVLRYTTDNETLVGLTSSGMAVTLYGNPCSFTIPSNPSANCFLTWDHGAIVGESVSLPALDYDDGTPCSPKASGVLYVYKSVCNGQRNAFEGVLFQQTGPDIRGLWTGPDLVADKLQGAYGNAGNLFLDARGDLAFTDGSFGWNYVAYDLSSVPEPSTFALLGTGLVGVAGAVRRRISS